MTSNIGSHTLLEAVDAHGDINEEAREQVLKQLRAHFRPEFLNRVDDIVLFKPLTAREVKSIVDKFMKQLEERLAERHMTITLTEEAKTYIATHGFDHVYGARPLKRFIQNILKRSLLVKSLPDVLENTTPSRLISKATNSS